MVPRAWPDRRFRLAQSEIARNGLDTPAQGGTASQGESAVESDDASAAPLASVATMLRRQAARDCRVALLLACCVAVLALGHARRAVQAACDVWRACVFRIAGAVADALRPQRLDERAANGRAPSPRLQHARLRSWRTSTACSSERRFHMTTSIARVKPFAD
eukprot:6139535-Pleurochrysis_carterae.AAC.3